MAGAFQRAQRGVQAEALAELKSCSVDSTAIAGMSYEPRSQSLLVTYTNARSYIYKGVSRQRYQAFCAAPSKGQYVNKQIKPNYPYERIV